MCEKLTLKYAGTGSGPFLINSESVATYESLFLLDLSSKSSCRRRSSSNSSFYWLITTNQQIQIQTKSSSNEVNGIVRDKLSNKAHDRLSSSKLIIEMKFDQDVAPSSVWPLPAIIDNQYRLLTTRELECFPPVSVTFLTMVVGWGILKRFTFSQFIIFHEGQRHTKKRRAIDRAVTLV